MYKLILEVTQVPKKCAAGYKIGDKIVIEDPKIMLNESTNVCLYALSSLMPYLTPLSRELMKDDWMSNVTELSCQDPSNAVRFRVTRVKSTP
ncbi:TIGR04076 family protein [Candidatus Bathyarchaeota archaeon]|nr:TIGR04076 family protein [Candidatus Bathyarchaeota archaeon]